MGSQIMRLSSGMVDESVGYLSVYKERNKCQQADDHGKGVMIQIARLQLPGNAREPAHGAGRAIDQKPIDHGDIAHLPEHLAGAPRPAGKDPVVEIIETVFVDE